MGVSLDAALRIDYIALHAQNDVVRSDVIRALFAETIGANGAIAGSCH